MKRVINFSGGATSALMTILLKPTEDDIVLFTDTAWEDELTYKFIDDFERFEGIKVHRTAYTHKDSPGLYGFPAFLNRKAYLPNRERRLCTDELKVKTAKRYLRSLGIRKFENYIGFRSDEMHRVKNYKQQYKNVHPRFPLVEASITKGMVDQYWLTKPYKLEIPRILGNCDLCFLKGKGAIINILQHHPERADKWIKAEDNKFGGTFIKDVHYKDLLAAAQSQKTLFDMELATPAYSCQCSNF
jgi:3'-phosphoadenosine 5'-phosphosulfate sulfotransferase (PAPS reductase)/FAD synthetase